MKNKKEEKLTLARKKYSRVLLITIILFALVIVIGKIYEIITDNNGKFAGNEAEIEVEERETEKKPVEAVLKEDKHFKIIDMGESEYYYAIYNAEGKIVKDGECFRVSPSITYIDANTIQVLVSAGTDTYCCIYYDILGDRVSEIYESPVTAKYNKIAYLDWRKGGITALIVKEMFDENGYYEEFLLDFTQMVSPVTYAEFLDENTLYISYYFGGSYEEKKTQVLELRDRIDKN